MPVFWILRGHFEDSGVNHMFFMPKSIHKPLKSKYEPNKYMLPLQTKIWAKSVIAILDTV